MGIGTRATEFEAQLTGNVLDVGDVEVGEDAKSGVTVMTSEAGVLGCKGSVALTLWLDQIRILSPRPAVSCVQLYPPTIEYRVEMFSS